MHQGRTRVELVAHRAGNQAASAAEATAIADLVELDVHWSRGRVEVRHAKRIWFTDRMWERWYLIERGVSPPTLAEVIAGLEPDAPLWFDLKGWSRRLSAAVLDAVAPRAGSTVSTKAWWLLRPFGAAPGVRTLRSAGNRAELAVLRRLRWPADTHGAVVAQRLLTAPLVRELRSRGELFSWGVTDRTRALELARWGVTGLIIDDLTLISELAAEFDRPCRVDRPLVQEPPDAI